MANKIVMVEDERMLADMYKVSLDAQGFDMHVAYDGTSGFALIEKEKPDLVLLDLMLPGMSGEDILKAIRGAEWGKDMKVVIMTNVSSDEAPPSLKSLGYERYLVKAIHTLDQIIQIVKEVMGSQQAAAQAS